MIIRPAQPTDATQICEIWNPIIRDTVITFTTVEKTPDGIQQTIASRYPFLVVEDGEQLLGFATYGPFRAGPGYARTRELSINLAATARRTGIGSQLLQALEIEAKSNGVTALIAAVSGANPAAVAFHTANNYAHVGTLPQVGLKFDQRLDLVLLQKLL